MSHEAFLDSLTRRSCRSTETTCIAARNVILTSSWIGAFEGDIQGEVKDEILVCIVSLAYLRDAFLNTLYNKHAQDCFLQYTVQNTVNEEKTGDL